MTKKALQRISIGLLLFSLLPTQAIAARVALVIGNADYARGTGWSDLPPALKDAETMAKVLKEPLGFDKIIHKTNLNRQQMLDALENFADAPSPGDTAFFYYSGHGAQLERNFLIPTNTRNPSSTMRLRNDAIALKEIQNLLNKKRTRLNILVLDACRNNPLSSKQKSFGGVGLKGMKRTTFRAETIIGFAAEPGAVAITGNSISPYTQALSQQLRQPNKSLWEIFGATTGVVQTATNGKQVPWKEDNLVKPHVLYATAPPPPKPVVTAPTKLPYEPEMVPIPGGTFSMGDIQGGGDSDEKPVHKVNIKSFMLSKHEVTLGQFKAFTQASGYQTDAEKNDGCYTYEDGDWKARLGHSHKNPGFQQTDQHPVACVSWNDAQAYIQWLNQQTGKTYRLPSEAEWEYAARAGSETKYHFGNDADKLCEYANGADHSTDFSWRNKACNDGYANTAPVGSFLANRFGLHDMHGNVWEWVQDCLHSNYENAPTNGKAWEEENAGDCTRRVVRGGGWYIIPRFLRSAHRYWSDPANTNFNQGFRLAHDL